jgi:hypothetical protein
MDIAPLKNQRARLDTKNDLLAEKRLGVRQVATYRKDAKCVALD